MLPCIIQPVFLFCVQNMLKVVFHILLVFVLAHGAYTVSVHSVEHIKENKEQINCDFCTFNALDLIDPPTKIQFSTPVIIDFKLPTLAQSFIKQISISVLSRGPPAFL